MKFPPKHSTLFLLIHTTLASKRPRYGWTVDTYPDIHSDSCFTKNKEDSSSIYICDADSFLKEESIDSLLSDDVLIPKLEEINLCSKHDDDVEDVEDDGKLEIVIAVAEKVCSLNQIPKENYFIFDVMNGLDGFSSLLSKLSQSKKTNRRRRRNTISIQIIHNGIT